MLSFIAGAVIGIAAENLIKKLIADKPWVK